MSNDILTDMIIEIPYNSNIKYEMENNILRCDRILNTSMQKCLTMTSLLRSHRSRRMKGTEF